MAPELLKEKPYSLPVDIWGLGVLLYAIVSSTLPFAFPKKKLTPENLPQLAAFIEKKLEFNGPKWLLVSDNLKSLLAGMLEKDPD